MVDPTTGVRSLQTSVDIGKDEVDEQFGEDDYKCECHAWNNALPRHEPLLTRSRKATLHVACEYEYTFNRCSCLSPAIYRCFRVMSC